MGTSDTNKIAAIHQPSFFPWMGYFNKIIRSDIFVILDSVQFPKTGGFWANRVKIIISGKDEWLTVPIKRNYSGTKTINEIEIDNSKHWNGKALKSIEINYRKSPYFENIYPEIKNLLSQPGDNLSEFNIEIITSLCSIMGIKNDHFIKSSEMDISGASTDLLVSIVRQSGCEAYMCGGGASKYQEDRKFAEAGIKLIYQNFKHPKYPQFNTQQFIPGLSVIDVLMNCGTEETRRLIENN